MIALATAVSYGKQGPGGLVSMTRTVVACLRGWRHSSHNAGMGVTVCIFFVRLSRNPAVGLAGFKWQTWIALDWFVKLLFILQSIAESL